MEIYPPKTLAERDFLVTFRNALAQYWHTTRSFQCIGSPKKEHLLLYLDGCRITYTDKAGRVTEAVSGDVVYTPQGSEYRAVLSDFCDARAHTVGINFTLRDGVGAPIALSEGIYCFRGVDPHNIRPLFDRALRAAEHPPIAQRILMLELLAALTTPSPTTVPAVLAPALRRLSVTDGTTPTVGELARECHISEPYLRKLFRDCLGTSPAAYRKRLCLERACSYLTYGDISVGEISEILGYASVSHFIKEFGRAYGISPLRYRKTRAGGDGSAY